MCKEGRQVSVLDAITLCINNGQSDLHSKAGRYIGEKPAHHNSQNGLSTIIRILTLSRLRRTRIAWSLNIRATSAGSPLWAISSCRARAIASCDRNTSNRPSHARSKNSSLWLNTMDAISGSALTSGAVRSLAISLSLIPTAPLISSASSSSIAFIPILKDLSPNALVMASSPITRLCRMKPPAARTRAASSGRLGLWSLVSSTHWPPPRHRTTRLSPTLAAKSRRPIRMTVAAVDPLCGADLGEINSLSARRYDVFRMRLMSSDAASSVCSECAPRAPLLFSIATRRASLSASIWFRTCLGRESTR
mmetsp:Transcript_2200/g.6412  ORF Transcript_2200/g.6412 Transcript_2200/m.6412 type:complete len:307 (-) Transcript_2200:1852-2772(-)